jgi:pyruvate ferredoxin oxidoreductase alpha subunit
MMPAGALRAARQRKGAGARRWGLLYAMEMLYNVSGWRAPVVMANVSRGLSAPITLESDHNDILAARDSGWLQIHCATCQEVLDSVLIAFRLAEDARVRLPVIVNLDGFTLSFTREPVEVPEAEAARAFLPAFDPGRIGFRASKPVSQAVAVLGGAPYSYFRYELHLAAQQALAVYDEVSADFARRFGRRHEAVEAYRAEDAELLFLMAGAFATKGMDAVDRLRASGVRIGLVRPRLLRPYPAERLRALTRGKQAVAVIDQNLSMGKGGVLHAELCEALYGTPDAPPLASFVGGLGGRDIPVEEFVAIAGVLAEAARTGRTPAPRLLFTDSELREVRKLQAIAHVERRELGV